MPTLAIRASEMNGLQFLPKVTKDRMVPCILLAPWANSNGLDRAVERVESAFRGYNFFLDIDRDYGFTNIESSPQRTLVELLDPADGYANWCSFVTKFPSVYPCIQTRGQSEEDIRRQIERYRVAGRMFCLRLYINRFPQNIDEVISALTAEGAADYAIILEGGWTRDPLSLSAWFDGVIAATLDPIDADIPIVLSCTSMPKLFTEFESGISRIEFTNRILVDQIRRSRGNRRSRLIYGDWGSTRPREPGGFASRPIPRIDYPTERSWCIARSRDENWNFKRAADLIINAPEWSGTLGIWGEEMISSTVINMQLGIDTPQKNVAARVNIHLHRQAFFGEFNVGGIDLDEEWQD